MTIKATERDGTGRAGARARKGRPGSVVALAAGILAAAAAGFAYGVPAAAALYRLWSEVMLPAFLTIYANGLALCF